MPPSETETLIAQAKAAANDALWNAVREVVSDTDEARQALTRVADDLESVWRLKLAGKDTTTEEKWLEKEAKLVAARLGVQANTATNRFFLVTANVLIGLGSALLSALLKTPIPLPPAGGGT